MQVFIERQNETKNLDFTGSAQELLDKLEINPQTVLIVKNDTLVTEDEIVEKEDIVKLVSVVSGG